MKIKCLCFMLASIFSIDAAFAMGQGQIISQKEWSTGDVKGSVTLSSTKPFPSKNTLLQEGDESYNLDSYMGSVIGEVNQETDMFAIPNVTIMNASKEIRVFDYQYSLCVRLGIRNTQCVHHEAVIRINPHDMFWDNRTIKMTRTFTVPGTYKMYFTALVVNSKQLELTTNAMGDVLIK